MKGRMKISSKTIGIILSMTALCSTTIKPDADIISPIISINPIVASAMSDVKVSGDWEYCIVDNSARIKAYTGTASNVEIPSELGGYPVEYIFAGVFENNNSIESVIIQEGVVSVASRCFQNASNLKTVSLPSTLERIWPNAFTGTAIESITIPEGVTKIETGTFFQCAQLETVELPSTIETIGEGAFSECGNLTAITLPSSLREIGNNAFGKTPLESIEFPSSLESIGRFAFSNTKIEIVDIPIGVEYIDDYAFADNENLHDVIINGTPSFGHTVFRNCESVYNIELSLDALNSALKGGALGGLPNLQCIGGKDIIQYNPKTKEPFLNAEFEKVIVNNVSTLDLSQHVGGGVYIEHTETPFFYNYLQQKIKYIVVSVTTENMSDIQKAKALHDWVCHKVDYDKKNENAAKNHEDSSIFFSDSTVCDGYARGYALLLQEAGIESYYVYNPDHAWNIVKLGDHYYHIDVCHDDKEEIVYTHFMLSDNSIKEKQCSHYSWKVGRPSSLFEDYDNDEVPVCNYDRVGDVNADYKITIDDLKMLSDYLHGKPVLKTSLQAINADLDFDGVIDAFDLVRMRQKIAAIATIITQPKNASAQIGETVSTSVEATGEGLTYQWYFKNPGASEFTKSSITDSTYEVLLSEKNDGRQVYCEVSDKHGNTVRSDTVTLGASAKIVTQPKNASAAIGSKVKTTVSATGTELKYQWYYKDSGASKFAKSSITSATYQVDMTAARDGRQVYCVITDKFGNTVTSSTVTLKSKVNIVTQPKNAFALIGSTAKTTVSASGNTLKYQWYYRKSGATTWSKSAQTAATYSIKMSTDMDGMQIYCVITDKYGNKVQTNTVTVGVKAKIDTQPKSASATIGSKVKTTVSATGTELKYQWYYKDTGASKFTKSSITSATYQVTMTTACDGRQVYCVITDKYGNTVTSSTVTLKSKVKIVTQPKDVSVAIGSAAKTTVSASGNALKYQWYYRKSGATTWTKSAQTAATYSIKMSTDMDGMQIYCVVTDKYGNKVQTNTVTLKSKVKIVTQPKNASAANGAKVKTSVSATGNTLEYQWYYCNANSTKWYQSSIKSATYSVTMSNSVNGRRVYCVIKDKYGNTVQTATVTLSAK